MIPLKEKRIRKKNQLSQWGIALSVLVALTGIVATNIVQSSRRDSNKTILPSANGLNQDQQATQDNSSAKAGIDLTIKDAIAKLQITFTVPAQFQGKTIYEVKPKNNEKVIALTFDDGPWPQTTSQVLNILKKNNIKATFFMVGQPLKEYPQIAQQVVAEGHAIGNHTWHHWYRRMNEPTVTKEFEDTAALLYKITGVKTSYFRPPGGVLHNGLVAYALKHKYAVMMWSIESGDSHARRPSAKGLTNAVLKSAKPGRIVLLHDGGGSHSDTVQALPQIIDGLKQRGYKFVTLPELLEKQDSKSVNNILPAGKTPNEPINLEDVDRQR